MVNKKDYSIEQNGGKEGYSPEGLRYYIQSKPKQKEIPKEEKIRKIIEPQYYPHSQQILITHLPYEIIMDAIKTLELKVEQGFSELTDKIDKLTKKETYESCVVYFKELDEKHKVFSYLINKKISF